MVDIRVKNHTLYIKSEYRQEIVKFMRSRPVRKWNVATRQWEIPEQELENFLPILQGLEYKIKYEDEQKLTNIPENYIFKTKPFEHQVEGVSFGLTHDKFLLADEPGLGKSKQVLDIAEILKEQNKIKHVLVITCVNSIKYNWRNEVSIHTNDTGYILGTKLTRKGNEYIGSNEDKLQDLKNLSTNPNYFIITNIETLRYNKKIEVPCKTKKNGIQRFKKKTVFPIVEELQKQINNKEISMIIADEVHKCSNSTSMQGRALLSLNCDNQIALTGTPIMNNPVDLYSIIYWLGYENHSLFAFRKHYCIMGGFGNHQVVGYKNLPELQSIVDKCMLRRLKEEVLDLPEKIYIHEYVEMTKPQLKIYEEVLDSIVADIDRIRLSPNPLTMLIRLRQVTGNPSLLSSKVQDNPKFDRMVELVEELVSNNEKCIIFSNWTNIINPAYELLQQKGFNPALYTGENSSTREEEKNKFQTDKTCKVILGTIDAMGTGLTLTEASTCIFLDEPWNRAKKDQCEDRIHRIGTHKSPNIITLMCKGSIDEKIHDIVYRKGKIADIIIDKEEDIFKNPKVLNYLLSQTS